jgi:rabenosyn-5
MANLSIDPGELWKGIIQGQIQGSKGDIRGTVSFLFRSLGCSSVLIVAEQRITPWQDDASVNKCPLCSYIFFSFFPLHSGTHVCALSASFHPLTNRKHHCRLCGQIICSLPVKRPQRPFSCSVLFVVDPKTRRIEEVNEGVDYGVRKRRGSTVLGSPGKAKDGEGEEEKFLKGVRICRLCRPILLQVFVLFVCLGTRFHGDCRKQRYNYEVQHVPPFVKLYEVSRLNISKHSAFNSLQAFTTLEKEIEDALPLFQELILTLK